MLIMLTGFLVQTKKQASIKFIQLIADMMVEK